MQTFPLRSIALQERDDLRLDCYYLTAFRDADTIDPWRNPQKLGWLNSIDQKSRTYTSIKGDYIAYEIEKI